MLTWQMFSSSSGIIKWQVFSAIITWLVFSVSSAHMTDVLSICRYDHMTGVHSVLPLCSGSEIPGTSEDRHKPQNFWGVRSFFFVVNFHPMWEEHLLHCAIVHAYLQSNILQISKPFHMTNLKIKPNFYSYPQNASQWCKRYLCFQNWLNDWLLP